MKPVIGDSYIGPFGRAYRVLDIEGKDGDMQFVVIQDDTVAFAGTIRFPLFDARKWLSPIPQRQSQGTTEDE